MKRLLSPIQVETSKGWPVQLFWKDRTIRVHQPLDYWIRESRWWADAEKRVYFFLETDAGILEIYRAGSTWILARRVD